MVGDFNNDQKLDIIIANTGTHSVGIFLGNNDGYFGSQTTYSTGFGSTPYMVASGDFNNDNRLDIAVANFGSNSIGVFLGRGDGTFKSQITIEITPSRPLCVVIGDLNNDQHLDIVVASYGTNSIGLLFGYGNGSFTRQTNIFTGYDSLSYALAVGDFNYDNNLDLAVANYGTNNVIIFLGYGNGTFRMQTPYQTGINSHPRSIVISDFNNDDKLDIAVATPDTQNFCVLFGLDNGMFASPKFYFVDSISQPIFITTADFNKDNKSDIAIVNDGTDSINILFGHGDGTFSNHLTYSTGPDSRPYSMVIGDFNSDGQIDIAIVNQQANNVIVFDGIRKEVFISHSNYLTNISKSVEIFLDETDSNSNPMQIAIGDVNDDSLMDIVVANSAASNFGIFFGCGNGTFSMQKTYSTGLGSTPRAVALGDFNNDGHMDIAVANYDAYSTGVFLGYGNGNFSRQTIYSTGLNSFPVAIAVADFNNDSHIDIAVANSGADSVGVFLGFGDGSFSNQTTYSTDIGSSPLGIAIGDLNNDGYLDITVANFYSNNIGVFLGYGNGSFSTEIKYSTGNSSGLTVITIGDLNNDNNLDIVIGKYYSQCVGVLLGYGNGSFSDQKTYSTGIALYPYSVIVGDFNNDNIIDIAAANYDGLNVGILLGFGNGAFSDTVTYQTANQPGPTAIVAYDFNNDHNIDLGVANLGDNNVAILLGYGDGTFPCFNELDSTNSYPISVAVGDLNNDTRLDIVVANYGTSTIDILFGVGNGSFGSQITYATGSCSKPIAVIVGDFNNDLNLDIVVANHGTHNIGIFIGHGNGSFQKQMIYSTGVNSLPQSIACGDFNHDGRLDIAVVNAGLYNVGVFLGYGDGTFSQQLIYSTGDGSYTKCITVNDFNNDGYLDFAVANRYFFGMGVFLGYGNGSFSDQISFDTGVFSYPKTLVTADFNNDKNIDIAVATQHTAEEHVIIFLGHGKGNFSINGRYVTGIGSLPSWIITGHFNNDSYIDLVVANRGTNNFGIFLNYGNGTFISEIIYPTNKDSQPISIAAGDFNNDLLTDLVMAFYGTSSVGVFLATFNTSFEYKTTCPTESSARPKAITTGDFNNDTHIDIIIADYGTQDITMLFNYGDGNFSAQRVYSDDSQFYPVSIAVTDFNNDDRLDVVIANSKADNVRIIFGEKDSTFGNLATYLTGTHSNPKSVAIGDFNNDRKPDVVVALSGTGSIEVLLRADQANFQSLKTFSTGINSKPQNLATGDFNNDGHLDIVVADNGIARIGLFLGHGNGTFSDQIAMHIDSILYPMWLAVADFNNDNRLDIIITDNVPPRSFAVLLGDGNATFPDVVNTRNIYGIAAGVIRDFNRDGKLDIAVHQPSMSTMTVLLGNGDGTFNFGTVYDIDGIGYGWSITVGDFNNDSLLDIAISNSGMDNIGIFLGYGDGTFRDQVTFSTGAGSSPESITVDDLNNDGRLDVVVANYGRDNMGVLLGNGDGTFQNQITYSTGIGSFSYRPVLSDFNNDGRLDIAVTNYQDGSISVLLGYINGTFFNMIKHVIADNSQPHSIVAADFNNDGRIDIAFTDMTLENIGVFFGYASEGFVATPYYDLGESSQPVSIAVGEFNGDGRLDVAIADQGNCEVIIAFGSGYGTFSNHVKYPIGNNSYPNVVVLSDLNEDHQMDIVVVNSGLNNIAIFFGYGNGFFSSPITYSTGPLSLPMSLSVGKFDNDTHFDVAVANYGISNIALFFGYGNGSFRDPLYFNTGFGSQPNALAFGNFSRGNSTDIVICYQGYSTLGILSKTC